MDLWKCRQHTPFKVNAVDPGFTKTDFNNHHGTGSVEEAGKRIAKYAMIGEDGPTGKFISEEQNPKNRRNTLVKA